MLNNSVCERSVPKHAFKTLVALWMVIFLVTFTIAYFTGLSQAKADIIPPQTILKNGLVKNTAPATISTFTDDFSPSLSAQIKQQCRVFLSPKQRTGTALNKMVQQDKTWNRRNVGTGGLTGKIAAIKSYRQCARQAALEELARN